MSAFVCDKCGGELKLSLPEGAYICQESPQHRCDRGEAEQSWVKTASKEVEDNPDNVDAVFKLASLCGRLASTSLLAGDPDPARAYMAQVVAVIEILHDEKKNDERVRAMFMEALVEQATVSEKLKDYAGAAGGYEKLVPLVQAQADAQPKNIERQRNLSTCLNSIGRMLRALGNGVGAKKYFEKDMSVLEHVAELYPENNDVQFDIAVAHFNLFLVSDARDSEIEHLHAVGDVISKIPESSIPDGATQLCERAKIELERIESSDGTAASRLAEVAADVARSKTEQPPTSRQGQRAWLIERVSDVLRERRRRLSVLN